MKKSLLIFVLSLLTAVTASAYDFQVVNDDGVTIYYIKRNKFEVYVCYESTAYNSYTGNVVIPAKVTYSDREYDVTGISTEAFKNCTGLTSVTIPGSVTAIDGLAFDGCSALTSIEIPEGVKIISQGVFRNCSSLASVKLPESLTEIKPAAFDGCSSLTSLDIPASVTTIESSAFRGCAALTSIAIPGGVTEITDGLFEDCSSLASVTLPNTVNTVRDYAFENCSALASIDLPESIVYMGANVFSGTPLAATSNYVDGVLYVGKYLISANSSVASTYTVKDGTLAIAKYAFNKKSLTQVTLPSTLEEIGQDAFSGCTSLLSVAMPNSVAQLGASCFEGCSALGSLTLSESVEQIRYSAFKDCTSLTEVTVPEGVKGLMQYCFQGCTSLTSVSLPGTLEYIGAYVFHGCTSLAGVTIPEGVERIGSLAFYDCASLAEVSIPKTVTEINTQAFQGCTGLKTVYNFSGLTFTKGATDYGYVANYAEYVYNNCEAWKDDFLYRRDDEAYAICRYKGSAAGVAVPSAFKGKAVTSLGDGCFLDNKTMQSVSLPEGLSVIGISAFEGCTGLTSVALPNTLTWLKERAFFGDTSLADVKFGSGVDGISLHCFEGCTSLTELVIPANIRFMSSRAFAGCSSITKIDCGSGLYSIGYEAFAGVDGIEYISMASATPVVVDNGTFTVSFGTPLYVPADIIDDYLNWRGSPWASFDIRPLVDITDVAVSGLDELDEIPVGTPIPLSATIQPANASLPYIFWRSTDPEMATVDNDGKVVINSSVLSPTIMKAPAKIASSPCECKIIAETMYAEAPTVEITITGDKVTAIETIYADPYAASAPSGAGCGDIYSLRGTLLRRNASSDDVEALAPGLYIVGGRKVEVR